MNQDIHFDSVLGIFPVLWIVLGKTSDFIFLFWGIFNTTTMRLPVSC
jgi:hypothetical protein